MTRDRIKNAEDAARQVARKSGAISIPVNLGNVCKFLNLVCIEKVLDEELSGMSFIREGQAFVVVNSRHSENRKRFTKSHEIGHHVLHSDYLSRNVHVDTSVLRRDELSSEGVYSKEIEANAFAAELLMPRSEVQKLTSLDLSDEVSVSNAAKRFGVSATALTFRISNLTNRRD